MRGREGKESSASKQRKEAKREREKERGRQRERGERKSLGTRRTFGPDIHSLSSLFHSFFPFLLLSPFLPSSFLRGGRKCESLSAKKIESESGKGKGQVLRRR